jgi:hypothetical protein
MTSTVTNAAGITYASDGLAERAQAEAACQICGKGIYQSGHDDDNRPLWLHVNGYRACGDDEHATAVAMPF